MKFLFLFSLITSVLLSPFTAMAGISTEYQIFDANGMLVRNQAVSIKVDLREGTATGVIVYSETHSVTTDDNGRTKVYIGQGTATTGNFSTIEWSNKHFIASFVDIGNGWVAIGSPEEIGVVPKALVAENGVKEINQSNYMNDGFTLNNMTLRVDGTITLAQNCRLTQGDGCTIIGGRFEGTGAQDIESGNKNTFIGVYFKNVREIRGLQGHTFIECTFEGSIDLPYSSAFISCTFTNFSSVTSLGSTSISKSYFSNSTIGYIKNLSNNQFNGCTIGGASNFNNNDFNNCVITLNGETRFLGNHCDECKITIGSTWRNVHIKDNYFNDFLPGEAEVIEINNQTSGANSNVIIHDNTFDLGGSQNNAINHIKTVGTFSNAFGYNCIISIKDNDFTGGNQCLLHTSSGVDILGIHNVVDHVTQNFGIPNNGTTIQNFIY